MSVRDPFAEAEPDAVTERLPAVRSRQLGERDKRERRLELVRDRRALDSATASLRRAEAQDKPRHIGEDVPGGVPFSDNDDPFPLVLAVLVAFVCVGAVWRYFA